MRLAALTILACLFGALAVPSGGHAQPAPAASPGPAARTLFLIRGPDGIITAIRAVSFQQQGAALLLVNASGGRAVVQARAVVGQLPWFPDEELEDPALDPAPLAAKYEVAARRIPSLQKVLLAEAARFHAVEKRRADAATTRKNAAEARIRSVTSAHYDPAAGYTPESLHALLEAAAAVRSESAEASARIEKWAAPFRDHLEKLQAGNRYENGAWHTPEELAAQARAQREAAFARSLTTLQISALALPAETVRSLVLKAEMATGIAMLAGLGLIALSRRRLPLRAAGVALFAGSPAILASLFFLATRNPGQLPADTPAADLRPLMDALADAAALESETPPSEHTISEAGLNTFLARHIRIARATDPDAWAVVREAIAVRLLPGRILLFELVRSDHRHWILRYDLAFRPTGIIVSGVKLGTLDLPPALAQPLWKNLEPQLAAILATLPITATFTIHKPADGTLRLSPLVAPPPAKSPPAAPEATPVPEATPQASPAATPEATPEEAAPSVPTPPPAAETPAPDPSANPFGPNSPAAEESPSQPSTPERSEESIATPTP